MKRLRAIAVGGLCAAILIGCAYEVYALSSRYLVTSSTHPIAVTCRAARTMHQVIIENNIVVPHNTAAKLCDSLVIINEDSIIRLIAFGPHEHHIAYDGITEQTLGENQSLTVILDQLGTYSFHDHLHYSYTTTGEFTVSR